MSKEEVTYLKCVIQFPNTSSNTHYVCFKETVPAPKFDFIDFVLRSYNYNIHGGGILIVVYFCLITFINLVTMFSIPSATRSIGKQNISFSKQS